MCHTRFPAFTGRTKFQIDLIFISISSLFGNPQCIGLRTTQYVKYVKIPPTIHQIFSHISQPPCLPYIHILEPCPQEKIEKETRKKIPFLVTPFFATSSNCGVAGNNASKT